MRLGRGESVGDLNAKKPQTLLACLMHLALVIKVARSFKLEGRMFEIKMIGEATLEYIKDLGCMAIAKAFVVKNDVGREGRQVRGHHPRMEIVHVSHMFLCEEMAADLSEINPSGSCLKQDTTRVAQERPSGLEHQRCNKD